MSGAITRWGTADQWAWRVHMLEIEAVILQFERQGIKATSEIVTRYWRRRFRHMRRLRNRRRS